MKKIALTLLCSTLLWSSQAQKRASLPINEPLPPANYELLDVYTGGNGVLQEMTRKNGLLVIFTSNTCPFVIKNKERTQQIIAFAKENDFGIVLVNSNEAQREKEDAIEKMVEYASTEKYPNYFVDKGSKLADLLGASHTPEVYLFSGKEPVLVYKGAMDDNPSHPEEAQKIYLIDAMTSILKGAEVEPKETKSIGCTIKRAN